MQHRSEKELNCCLEEHAEQNVARAHESDFPPSAFSASTALVVTERECDVALLFDRDSEARNCAIEGEEGEGREDIAEEAHEKSSQEFDLQWWVGEDEGGPGKVEEEEVDRGAPGGEGGDGEEGEERGGEESVCGVAEGVVGVLS